VFDSCARHWRVRVEDGTLSEDEAGPVHQSGLRLEEIRILHTRRPVEAAFPDEHRDAGCFAQPDISTLRS